MHWDYSWPLSWLFVALVYLTPLLITVDTGAAVKNTAPGKCNVTNLKAIQIMATKEKRNPQLQKKKNSFREMGGTQQFPSGNKGQANFVWPITNIFEVFVL